ncbi:hypothetical protein [Mesorhizobium tamadayense]|uniref:hypothetical protein n=1 Tax=Mesorhizobium tamadayense TaxID=425306 RepID=UPI0026BE1B7F
MTQMEIQAPTRNVRAGYKVDVSRGQRVGRVSSKWFNRPADERGDPVRSRRSQGGITMSSRIQSGARADVYTRITAEIKAAIE